MPGTFLNEIQSGSDRKKRCRSCWQVSFSVISGMDSDASRFTEPTVLSFNVYTALPMIFPFFDRGFHGIRKLYFFCQFSCGICSIQMIESGFIFQRQLRMSASGNGELWAKNRGFHQYIPDSLQIPIQTAFLCQPSVLCCWGRSARLR